MSIGEYLDKGTVMQLATVAGSKPWICTVYFVRDEQNNIYWLSTPSRRHSRELAGNSSAAATFAIKTDVPVIGLSVEGAVTVEEDLNTIESVMKTYVQKYKSGDTFHENVVKSTNQHVMYKLTPEVFTLFDEVNFSPDQARQEFQNL